MIGHPCCERLRDIPPRTEIQQGPLAIVEVKSGCQAQRPHELDLDCGRRILFGPCHVGQHIDVGGQRRPRPLEVLSRAVHQPPAVWLDVDRELNQQAPRPADRVRADAPVRQFGEERHVRVPEFSADGAERFSGVIRRPRSQCGCAGPVLLPFSHA